MVTASANAFSVSAVEKLTNNVSQEQMNFMSSDELGFHIRECILNDRASQKKIYHFFYRYAKTICDRYAKRNDDSQEIVNDSFLKMFRELHRYKPAYSDPVSSFKGWLKRIVIHTAIDHFRKNHKHAPVKYLPEAINISAGDETALDNISHKELIKAIQNLSPGYRTIFNLHIIEGLTHNEISKRLRITVGASKSNLSKARRRLQKILFQRNQIANLSV